MNTWRAPLLLVLLTAALAGGLLALFVEWEREKVATRLARQAQLITYRQAMELEDRLSHVIKDLRFIANLFDRRERLSATELQRIQEMLLGFSAQQQFYDQIRYIDDQGEERFRINLSGEQALFIPEAQLQNKRHRYYFRDSIDLPHGSIYISPFDLNIEQHAIELPFKPMIRFATPVVDRDEKNNGIVILNYLGKRLIDRLPKPDPEFPGQTILINANGDYLTAFEADKAWGFMFPDRKQQQFRTEYPAVWKVVRKQQLGQENTPEGDIFTFGKVTIASHHASDSCGNCYLYIINRLTGQQLRQLADKTLHITPWTIAITYAIFLTITLVIHWRLRTSQRSGETTRRLIRNVAHERDLFADGPAVLFRWRNEFGWPVEHVSNNLKAVLGYEKTTFLNGTLGFASIVLPDDLPRITEELSTALRGNLDNFFRAPYRIIDAEGRQRWVRDAIRVVKNNAGEVVELYAYLMDIDAVKKAEEELEHSRAYIQHLLDTIPDPTLVIDSNTHHIASANQAAYRTYLPQGLQPNEAICCYQLAHKRDRPCSGRDEPCPIDAITHSKKATNIVHKHYDARGLPFYVEIHASPLFDDQGRVIQILESHRDITKHIRNQEALQQQAFTDGLTGIANRTAFERLLEQETKKLRENGGSLGLIMFDLDHFKKINDRHGHQSGDRTLIEVVSVIQRQIRGYDLFSRWGGEEFMVLLPRSGLDETSKAAEHLRRAIEQHHFDAIPQRVTISLGVTSWMPGDTIKTLVSRADQALYRSKQQGRNRSTVSDTPPVSINRLDK
ncbi:MAG: hypothetical protein B0D96_01320 [Candidatus Sedimenticola endophacoides]|uniref:diguanylate cyclase n=1 Tax=Candidatus Sedimenticola endophacoides TaxID=2548426 RepID=A0A6N4DEC5_9GAMM|nr:MAG: hypothetical protein B0D94_04505 [Candidatus Sedimenticola endophacoides]OQX37756.1 MAG: hypothetical protein B0D96_01320 [Candidatus Sedimenticola endophacoides]OQX38991.1 MAG: hypothetical protein B0D89_11675 [Candidatus Sedimenticola endophacoides]OQX46374.1 MAG: hypothetical protein B0D90_01220 [Candidatus Sedimenticola endophacoides]OQX47294.1 MAG: hypothetical protein B0D85_01755 [Candidatus Sedimenticola endophacoides]